MKTSILLTGLFQRMLFAAFVLLFLWAIYLWAVLS